MWEIERLVSALRTVAFPHAPELSAGAFSRGGSAAGMPASDPAEEIRKYKALMDEGVISRQEFEAKKKQIMGILNMRQTIEAAGLKRPAA